MQEPLLIPVCRLSCCVAGVCKASVKEDHLKETLELLAERLKLPTGATAFKIMEQYIAAAIVCQCMRPHALSADRLWCGLSVVAEEPDWLPKTHPLSNIETSLREGCNCSVCGLFTRMPLVTPCAHLLCAECAAPHRSASQQAPFSRSSLVLTRLPFVCLDRYSLTLI